jgi:hypothetical protein
LFAAVVVVWVDWCDGIGEIRLRRVDVLGDVVVEDVSTPIAGARIVTGWLPELFVCRVVHDEGVEITTWT